MDKITFQLLEFTWKSSKPLEASHLGKSSEFELFQQRESDFVMAGARFQQFFCHHLHRLSNL